MAFPVQIDDLPSRPAQAWRVSRAGLASSLFQTARLGPRERFAAWRESIGVLMDVSLAPGDSADRFAASVESYLIDGIMLSRCVAGQQKFSRPVSKFARDGIDHYMIQLFIRGRLDMRRGRQPIRGQGGSIVAFDCGDVLDSINSDFDLLSIFIPRRRLAPLLRRPDSLHGVCPDPESGAGRMLTGFLLDLYLNAPWLAERDAKVMADMLITLVAQAMNHTAPRDLSQEDGMHACLLRARSYIRAHLADSGLGEEEVAAAAGISLPELRHLFEPVGGLNAFVTEQRLRLAAARLREGEGAGWAGLSREVGFSSQSAFRKAFRARFGCTPDDVWHGRRVIGRADRHALSPLCGDRAYEDWIVCLA